MASFLRRLSLADPGVRVGTLSGVPLRVQPVTLPVGLLVVISLSGQAAGWLPPGTGRGTAFTVGAAAYALFLASLLAHEFAHVLVARRFGVACGAVVLTPFGMYAEIADLRKAHHEGAVALAGPAVSVALALAATAVARHLDGPASVLAWMAAYANFAIAAFNLVPSFPMDGGRVVRAVAWGWTGDLARGTRIAAQVGWAGALLVAALGVMQILAGNPLGILWLIVAFWTFSYAAGEVRARAASVPPPPDARALMCGFGINDGAPGVTLCPLALEGRLEAAAVFWDGERKLGHVPASSLVRVAPDACIAEMRAAACGCDGWPVLLVVDKKPLGYIPVGKVMAQGARIP